MHLSREQLDEKVATYHLPILGTDTSGRNEPMKLRSDFSEASTKLHRLHRESGEKPLAPIPYWQYQKWHPSSSSSSTSWWQWNDSWWSSLKLGTCQTASELMKRAACRTGRPGVPFLQEARLCKIFLFVVVRSFTADSSLLQPTGWCEQHTSHVIFSHFFTSDYTHTRGRLSQALVHFLIDRASLFTDHRISGRPICAKYKHCRTI